MVNCLLNQILEHQGLYKHRVVKTHHKVQFQSILLAGFILLASPFESLV